ncbi:MAG: type II toxin-antitoxin system HicA family toxin [Verrucomicrobiota bacterium]|nr:type II toxin-antitoxin system HicA family toxin [Verrucomicrobiota bacterium]MCC6821580.1 type II toxin-antitoxin system HicA family toxin [Limisphaerales bacterium]
MSRPFPVCNAPKVVQVLRRNGFVSVDQRGSHPNWRHPDGRQVITAQPRSKPIPIGTLKSTITGSGLDVDNFR